MDYDVTDDTKWLKRYLEERRISNYLFVLDPKLILRNKYFDRQPLAKLQSFASHPVTHNFLQKICATPSRVWRSDSEMLHVFAFQPFPNPSTKAKLGTGQARKILLSALARKWKWAKLTFISLTSYRSCTPFGYLNISKGLAKVCKYLLTLESQAHQHR